MKRVEFKEVYIAGSGSTVSTQIYVDGVYLKTIDKKLSEEERQEYIDQLG